ncbi:MAG TPA: class F sortase [Actinoplanes sp.]|nr:class F sortase [Actinoplanes sp.]
MPPPARLPALVLLAAALVAGLTAAAPDSAAGPAPPPVAAPAAPGPVHADSVTSDRTYAAVAPPVRVRIAARRVDSRLDRLGRQPDGTVAVPERTAVAGWYERGPRPGQAGPAVILGHVDSRTGPGVFARLDTIRPGTPIRIDRADGSAVVFRVTAVSRVPKTRFPTDLVYAPTLDPALRLITCGGDFDHARESYRDNVIVYAEPA